MRRRALYISRLGRARRNEELCCMAQNYHVSCRTKPASVSVIRVWSHVYVLGVDNNIPDGGGQGP